jgi:hypothetical protein
MTDNICPDCKGTGQQWSGVEYAGAHEMLACDSCCGTGFDDPALEIGRLREVLLEARGLHYQCKCGESPDHCVTCGGLSWPCVTKEILDRVLGAR